MVDQVKEVAPKFSLSELAERRREEMVQSTREGQVVRQLVREERQETEKQETKAQEITKPAEDEKFYFQSNKSNFSFIYKRTRKQVKFDGFYFSTDDKRVAAYIRKCYGNDAMEIDKEAYEEGTVLRPGDPEPVRSSIFVNRLPGS